MALRPRAVITSPYPRLSTLARALGISAKHYRELRARVTEALAREHKQSATKRTATRRRKARRS